MKKNIKKILAASTISLLLVPILYTAVVEPTVTTAATAPDDVVVTLVVDAGITITDGSDVTMAPNLGITANSSIGNSYWTVKTNNLAGYSLAVKASSAPALVSGTKSIADFQSVAPAPWSVASGAKEFGFSAFGANVDTGTWGTGAGCGTTGTPSATLKYLGFKTTDKAIATLNSVTPTAGVRTDICFAVEQKDIYADSGTYQATITATASTL